MPLSESNVEKQTESSGSLVSKNVRTGRLERELQMVQHYATR